MGKLNALSVKAINKPGKHGDGDGLYLYVAPSGSKSWVQRIVVDGRRRDIGLGSFPAVSLAQARSLAALKGPSGSKSWVQRIVATDGDVTSDWVLSRRQSRPSTFPCSTAPRSPKDEIL